MIARAGAESLRTAFPQFRRELEGHLHKEEAVLIPLIVQIESAVSQGRKPARQAFGSIANPIGMMEQEHEAARRSLGAIRKMSGADGETGAKLAALEADLDVHSRLEDEILFPRATALEGRQDRSGGRVLS